jgi:hypothetical protein
VIAFAIVTVSIFAWPGSGKLLIDSINQLDRPVIVAYLMVTVTIFIAINFAVDVLYSLLDPRVIEAAQLAREHTERPAVRDDVVQRDEQPRRADVELHEHGANERTVREIERLPGLGRRDGPRGFLPFVFTRPVGLHSPQRERIGRIDDLERASVHRREAGSQGLVPIDDRAKTRLERVHVERTAQTIRGRDVVRRAVGLELIDEPEPLLRKGQRQGVGARQRDEGGRARRRMGRGFLLETQRQARTVGSSNRTRSGRSMFQRA